MLDDRENTQKWQPSSLTLPGGGTKLTRRVLQFVHARHMQPNEPEKRLGIWP
jgi:hypothetical protein